MLLGALLLFARTPAAAAPWLFITDIHLKATHQHSPPSKFGDDTDEELFDSAIRAMRRVDPHPPVVVVTGDLLAHDITKRTATPTTVAIASKLGAAFPAAQFILALGNEDGPCGDYGLTPDTPFLRTAAAAWAPLVNRHGAAPDFVRTFVHDGSYVARLPIPGLHAVVADDVFWSPRYRSGCGPAGDIAEQAMRHLETTVRRTPGRIWLLFHIPPGIDAFSTAQLTRGLVIVPFLRPDMRDRLIVLLTRAAPNIALVVNGHTHKFAYRVVDATGAHPVPMLLVPSISPIFRNTPSFLTANVSTDGTLRDVEETSYIHARWQTAGGLRSLGLDAFTGPGLVALGRRLDRDPQLRAEFARLYSGEGPPEITERSWSVYACAATAFTTAAFRGCIDAGGVSFLTRRGIVAALVALVAFAVAVAAGWFALRRRRRLRT